MLTVSEIDNIIDTEFTAPANRWREAEPTSGWFEFEEVLYGKEPVEIPELGTVRLVEEVGGEGQGDHMHIVFELTDKSGKTRLLKKDGYYSSYGESEYDSPLREVRAVEKTVTVYE